MSDELKCSEEGCDKTIKNHLWGHIKADGWFFSKDGSLFCPDHVPAWVADWRKRKRNNDKA